MMYKFVLRLHRVLGAILSLYLLIWFLSAFVIIYHPYPRYTEAERLSHLEEIDSKALPDDDTMQAELRARGQTLANGETLRLSNEGWSERTPKPFDYVQARAVASLWGKALLSVDTLHSLDQWTPFAYLREDLPFYRLNLSGDDGHEVYVSSRDGHIITEHTRSERVWAWLGAIPHWVYFTWLRQDADLWRIVVVILSGIGTVMTLAGLYLGVVIIKRERAKKRRGLSPYKKPIYYWHHIGGTFGGVFILFWLLSGLFSVVDLPSWLVGERDERVHQVLRRGTCSPESYQTKGLKAVLEQTPAVLVEWTALGDYPLIRLITRTGERLYYDASGESLKPLHFTLEDGQRLLSERLGLQVDEAEKLNSYDGYYLDREARLPLPVYRYTLAGEQAYYVYIAPTKGLVRLMSKGDRLRMWLYNKPHSLKFAWLAQHPKVWFGLVWFLLTIGVVVSLTGLLLTFRRLVRMFS